MSWNHVGKVPNTQCTDPRHSKRACESTTLTPPPDRVQAPNFLTHCWCRRVSGRKHHAVQVLNILLSLRRSLRIKSMFGQTVYVDWSTNIGCPSCIALCVHPITMYVALFLSSQSKYSHASFHIFNSQKCIIESLSIHKGGILLIVTSSLWLELYFPRYIVLNAGDSAGLTSFFPFSLGLIRSPYEGLCSALGKMLTCLGTHTNVLSLAFGGVLATIIPVHDSCIRPILLATNRKLMVYKLVTDTLVSYLMVGLNYTYPTIIFSF